MTTSMTTLLKGYLNRTTPGYMVFFVTPLCDCRCRMCFNWKTIRDAAHRSPLTLDEIEQVARRFPGLHHVNFSGGEPFLRDDFSSIPPLFYEHSGTRMFACPTNSSRPEVILQAVEEICFRCPDAWIRITQSLDGVGEDHDAIRGKPGLFEHVLALNDGLSLLQRRHPNLSVGLAMVMSGFNEGKEHAILDFACERLSFADFGVIYARGDTCEGDAKNFSARAYGDFIAHVREKMNARSGRKGITGRLFTAISAAAADVLVESATGRGFVTPCRAGENMVVMDDEGRVMPCEVLGYYIETGTASLDTAVFGNIRDFGYDIRKILDTERARSIRDYIRESRCHCTFECAMSVNVLYSAHLWPRVLRHFCGPWTRGHKGCASSTETTPRDTHEH